MPEQEKKAEGRKLFLMRHGERCDFVEQKYHEGTFFKNAFDENGNYNPYDINFPSTVPEREDGWKAYQYDCPLTEVGKFEAVLTGRAYKAKNIYIDHVYSSPVLRCIETAASFIESYGNPLQISVEPGIFEWGGFYKENQFLSWMKPQELIREGYPINESYVPIMTNSDIPRGEKVNDYYHRCERITRAILEKHPKENLLFVGHGSTIDANSRLITGGQPRSLHHFFHMTRTAQFLANVQLTEQANGSFKIDGRPIPNLTVSNVGRCNMGLLTKTDEEVEEVFGNMKMWPQK